MESSFVYFLALYENTSDCSTTTLPTLNLVEAI
jgi:hypothetical protein